VLFLDRVYVPYCALSACTTRAERRRYLASVEPRPVESDPQVVTFAELRLALDLVLAEAEQRLGASVDLGADFYWSIANQDVYALTEAPPGPTLGSLSDDVESVRTFLNEHGNEDEHIIVSHELAHICGILGRIGAVTDP
jgi:hypothetical protein